MIMNKYKILAVCFAMLAIGSWSCQKHLQELNVNPNGADPETTNPDLVLTTVLTESAKTFVTLGYGDIAGVMQHTQKDGWGGGHNNYDWGNSNSWGSYYDILRNNRFVYEKCQAKGYSGRVGVTLVMKSLVFGLITDLWGDVPYSQALNGDKGGNANTFPTYDPQKNIYDSILANLELANNLLSGQEYAEASMGNADVYYQGDFRKWRKFANSLALRYYMRLAEKEPQVAKAGIEKIVNDPSQYPIITSAADDPTMSFPGNSDADSWPSYAIPQSDSSNYRRIKMCNTLVSELLRLNDPRIEVWASRVQVSILYDPSLSGSVNRTVDTVIDGESRTVRVVSTGYLNSKGLTEADINQDPHYVGLPVALNTPQLYNLSPTAEQAAHNPHVSWVNPTFANSKGAKARVLSAAEVHFILAEASAAYGWNAGDAEAHYKAGIKASFDAWGLSALFDNYMAGSEVAFDGTQKQILTQKWIASWSVATEAWFDWRRTGYPELHGVEGRTVAKELPLRFYYPLEERNLNSTNVTAASGQLEVTQFSNFGGDGPNNSPWSRPWIVKETGKPW
jgi:hypothetical protein